MTDPTVPEAAVQAVQRIPGSPRGISGLYEEEIRDILTAAGPHIGAAYLRRAAQTIRDRYPADIWADPTGPGDTPSRTGAHMCRRVAEQLDHMAKELETDHG